MLKAVLFDFDGTLADTVPAIMATIEKVRIANNFDYGECDIPSLIGKPLVDIAIALVGEENRNTFMSCYHDFYEEACKGNISLYEGIKDLLGLLKNAGVKVAVVTSKRREALEMNIRLLACGGYFDLLLPLEDQPQPKPAGECAEKALSFLGVSAEESVFVGDSVFDIGCGKNAGMRSIAVTWGAGTNDDLKLLNPDFIADTRDELKNYLLSLMRDKA